jgi:hypothetical protein
MYNPVISSSGTLNYFTSYQPLWSIGSSKGSVTRGDTTDVKRIRPLALLGAATGLLLLVLTFLLSLALRFPSLWIGIRPPIVAGSGTAPIFIVGEVGRVAWGWVARVIIRVEAWEVALDLADVGTGASLVALEEYNFDATWGEEGVVPEID